MDRFKAKERPPETITETPWEIGGDKGHVVCEVPTAFNTITIRAPRTRDFACPSVKVLDDQGLANARLITQAPRMLETLKGIVAALTQNATTMVDIAMCVEWATEVIEEAEHVET